MVTSRRNFRHREDLQKHLWMRFDEALNYLLGLGHETLTIKLGLANTEKLLQALGNPQAQFPAVQIAGTNGKGSTAVMLDSICRAAGIRTGLFTSPHLISITERISIGGQEISADDFACFTTRVKSAAQQLVSQGELVTLPTFFEQLTAIALLAFSEARIELVILETGLGGRLDSTTAVRAGIVAITPIAMDHQEYLGGTLDKIAAEKAAIIRSGVKAIIAPQEAAALAVILQRCEDCDVAPLLVGPTGATSNTEESAARSFAASADGRTGVSVMGSAGQRLEAAIGLRGRHQLTNAKVAIGLVEALRQSGFEIPAEAVRHGIASAKHAGRLEFWEGSPRILFDGAHNPAAARALRDFLDEFVKEPITIIFAAMRDKSFGEMAATLFPKARAVILTEIDNPRAASTDVLRTAAPDGFDPERLYQATCVRDALRIAREITSGQQLICVTGSLYLVGAVQAALREQGSHRPVVQL